MLEVAPTIFAAFHVADRVDELVPLVGPFLVQDEVGVIPVIGMHLTEYNVGGLHLVVDVDGVVRARVIGVDRRV